MLNKTFMNVSTGQIKKVISYFEDIAVLDGNIKVKSSELLDKSQWTDLSSIKSISNINESVIQPLESEEAIDTESFFNMSNNSFMELANKIRNIPSDNLPIDQHQVEKVQISASNGMNIPNEPAYTQVSIEEQKAELMKKYGAIESNTNSIERQSDAFNKLLNPETKNINNMPNENLTRIDVNRDEDPNYTSMNKSPKNNEKSEEEKLADMLFKNAKRNTAFNFSIVIDSKIPRIDFIEMMEDSYDVSIIEYFTNKIMSEFLEDTDFIKEQISNKIKEMIGRGEKDNSNDKSTEMQSQQVTIVDMSEEDNSSEIPEVKPKTSRRGASAKKTTSGVDTKITESKTTKTTRKKTPSKTNEEINS